MDFITTIIPPGFEWTFARVVFLTIALAVLAAIGLVILDERLNMKKPFKVYDKERKEYFVGTDLRRRGMLPDRREFNFGDGREAARYGSKQLAEAIAKQVKRETGRNLEIVKIETVEEKRARKHNNKRRS